ncbi:MAG: four helix bundle protein [Aequorivita sp.]|jgi:four helix bundle protein|nr:four helix bundle protein [Aequorivita sp.]MBP40644.1 four helix bundle protein [Aequorivita sp.]|tara:strand:+ start:1655 stop:2038 length:384 start_codon:yes stop_codon:yes gene_type:complete
MADVNSFEDLNCWKMGRELRNEVKDLIKTFPDFEKYELVSQMRRSSRSVTHNISEGYGRFHYKENIQFCRTSRGSLYELLDQFITSLDEGYINEEEYQKYKKRVNDCLAVLNGYINYLKKASINDNK